MVVQEFTVDLNKPLVFQVCFTPSCFFAMIVVNLSLFEVAYGIVFRTLRFSLLLSLSSATLGFSKPGLML